MSDNAGIIPEVFENGLKLDVGEDGAERKGDASAENGTPIQIVLPPDAQLTMPPPTTTLLGSTSPPQAASSNLRKKVPFAIGYSPRDWSYLTNTAPASTFLPPAMTSAAAAPRSLQRFTLAHLQEHDQADDAYLAIGGKVYYITPYLPFHPGGKAQLLRGAGKDATHLFMKAHPWVNPDRLLARCHIGYLVRGEDDGLLKPP